MLTYFQSIIAEAGAKDEQAQTIDEAHDWAWRYGESILLLFPHLWLRSRSQKIISSSMNSDRHCSATTMADKQQPKHARSLVIGFATKLPSI